jgi:hypothetical protein
MSISQGSGIPPGICGPASDAGTSEQAAVTVEREEKPVFLPDFDEKARWRFSQDARSRQLGGRLVARHLECKGRRGALTAVDVEAEGSHAAVMAVPMLMRSDAIVQRMFTSGRLWARSAGMGEPPDRSRLLPYLRRLPTAVFLAPAPPRVQFGEKSAGRT